MSAGTGSDDANEYTSVELMICQAARLIEDSRTVFIGYGMPQIAAILAQRLYAPNICQVYEYGAIGPEVATPFRRNMMADARNSHHAVCWTNMTTMVATACAGFIDYGILGAAQLDRFGNINSTMIGSDYRRPKLRFTGSGGGNEVASLCWRTIILMQHEKRRFLEKVDFITSPGYLDGTQNARERAGLPEGTGPYRVITSMALFDFEPESNHIRLIGLAPGVTEDDVKDNMGFDIPVKDGLEQLEPPKQSELDMLRNVIDPERVVIGKVKV
ncbi:MAG: acyl CoA--acetate/3-ketoacid CoA transferase subunit beta [Thermoplasmata archaeon]|nr:MAG: acyl CoA--acetate/3-ketoacid CoA transferase subunit beta [Thermoplasmata archaeon]